jgi:imidazolonepropionase-like amidohydrolase/ABC-type multidrug transport system permease subunit
MQAYLAQIRMTLRLVVRNRAALIFGYGFPLVFFFLFSGLFGAGGSGSMAGQVVSMVLTIGVLGSGFFGAGLQAVQNREQNILRRFKVAPITPAPMLVAAIVASLVSYMPMSALIVVLAHRFYGMPWPQNPLSLFLFIAIGVVTFCTMGNIVAAVVNSMQEAQLLTNLLYMPMLMLGGAAIPLSIMPQWVQLIAQFLPSSYFMTGVQSILSGRTTFIGNLGGVGALVLTSAVGTLLGIKLFRWEKEEKMRSSAKFWLVGVLAPFIVLGAYQVYAKGNINQVKLLARDVSRSRTWLIHDARVFVGDGTVIEQGSVLIRNGMIAQVYKGSAPDAKSLNADVIEGAGKTLLPGLIDMHVHLGAPGISGERGAGPPDDNVDRELAAYLYSGVTAVKSMGDGIDSMLQHRTTIASGDKLGAELFTVGPMFTTEGGHGTEFLSYVPQQYREQASVQTIRMPKTPDEARAQVAELKMKGVDGIKAILDAGGGSTHFNRMDTAILKALVDAAHAANLPIMVHTGSAQDVADALAAGVDGIEHGAMRDAIPPELLTRMRDKGISYDPTLVALETIQAFIDGNTSPLDRSLVQQIVPADVLAKGKQGLTSDGANAARDVLRGYPFRLDVATQNLAAANRAGVTLVAGTDSGNPMLVHGPAVHREMQLWVKAGVPAAAALQAATYNAAHMLKADGRIGLVQEGREANLLLVDGNPLEDISATERISTILFKGERVNRAGLFDQK